MSNLHVHTMYVPHAILNHHIHLHTYTPHTCTLLSPVTNPSALLLPLKKQLDGHPNIIHFVAAVSVPPSKTPHGNAEFLIQTELCTGGKMEDIVISCRLSPRQVLRVFYETCSAIAHMHGQDPPIIHRDIKVCVSGWVEGMCVCVVCVSCVYMYVCVHVCVLSVFMCCVSTLCTPSSYSMHHSLYFLFSWGGIIHVRRLKTCC